MKPAERVGSERGLRSALRRWRRRREALILDAPPGPSESATVVVRRSGTDSSVPPPQTLALVAGAYITDGSSLLRVEHVHTDRSSGKTFFELEDCLTADVTVCTADSLSLQPLRSVVPVDPPLPARPSPRRPSARSHATSSIAPG